MTIYFGCHESRESTKIGSKHWIGKYVFTTRAFSGSDNKLLNTSIVENCVTFVTSSTLKQNC